MSTLSETLTGRKACRRKACGVPIWHLNNEYGPLMGGISACIGCENVKTAAVATEVNDGFLVLRTGGTGDTSHLYEKLTIIMKASPQDAQCTHDALIVQRAHVCRMPATQMPRQDLCAV